MQYRMSIKYHTVPYDFSVGGNQDFVIWDKYVILRIQWTKYSIFLSSKYSRQADD